MLSWSLSLAFTTFIALWVAKHMFIPHIRVRTYKRAAEIRRLLNSPHSSLEDLLRARALPNQRLVNAFRITSTFVTGDTKVHKTFTTRAKGLIAPAGDKNQTWRALALNAEETSRRYLPTEHSTVDFSTVIQCITFAVVLSTLFHTDLERLRYEDVVHATNIINQRWKDSKTKDADTLRQDQDSLHSLLAHIERWVVDYDRCPNPLNFILPAYETLWRVVAVAVAYVYCYRNNTLHDAVISFGRDLTEERFATFGADGQQPSMQAIILEVLRLHPPTRHIVRSSGGTQSAGRSWWWRMFIVPALEVADVESVHLSDEYGENTSTFDPMRFHPSRMTERPELYSFGFGRLKCVAAAWAPMAAAVITATIVTQIEEMGCTVITGPQDWGAEWVGRMDCWKVNIIPSRSTHFIISSLMIAKQNRNSKALTR